MTCQTLVGALYTLPTTPAVAFASVHRPLSCAYLAHHEPESKLTIMFVIVDVNISIVFTGFGVCGCVAAASECRPICNQQYVQVVLFCYSLLLYYYYCYLAVGLLCRSGANSSCDQM